MRLLLSGLVRCAFSFAIASAASAASAPQPDEAQFVGRPAASFPQASENYFHDMDNGAPLNADQVKGRNMWIVWTGGNDRFWDKVTQNSLATFDLLKIITSHPSQAYCDGQRCDRDTRWKWLGALNEPCFEKPTTPDPTHFGLWLDHRSAGCAPDPFENATNYPGVKIGQRGQAFKDGTTLPVGSYFGEATGILGLRLFPNPEFDEAAKAHWDPERYYSDYKYYTDPKLVRPYRVGMSCGFCHVGPSPTHPPADASHPEYSNLNSTVGAQYLWMDRIFVWSADAKNFVYQLVHSYLPGTMDTSLVSTDYINNPRTMNAVYLLGERLRQAHIWGRERLEDNERQNKQLPGTFDPPATSWSPRVLKDGADSVGVLGALNRVYINIGLYSEDWTTHFNPFFGFKPISPILIPIAERYSSYWRATEAGTPSMAAFLVAAGQPDKLANAPGGAKYLNADADTLKRGERVFAETCARCHSSKQPPEALKMMPDGCSGANYLQCFMRYWAYTKTDDYKAKMRDIVAAPDFLKDNYLSTDARIPVTLLRTNACSPLGTNAIRRNIWDNFSSETYKSLPSVGKVTVQDPFTAERSQFPMPDGGLGFTRVPSLIGIWSTAPLLLNNRLGPFSPDPSVDSRMSVFDASIEQLLWPEKRQKEPGFDGYIARTTERSAVYVPYRNIPGELSSLIHGFHLPVLNKLFDKDGGLTIGPIPKGFPINLASNVQPAVDLPHFSARRVLHDAAVAELIRQVAAAVPSLDPKADDAALLEWGKQFRGPLLKLLKCPDFVVNRGHYFGTAEFNDTTSLSSDEQSFGPEPALSEDDKHALVEFIKTF